MGLPIETCQDYDCLKFFDCDSVTEISMINVDCSMISEETYVLRVFLADLEPALWVVSLKFIDWASLILVSLCYSRGCSFCHTGIHT